MAKTVSLAKINELQEAHNKVIGTTNYTRYLCECSHKKRNGDWYFLGHYVPDCDGTIKTIRGNVYLYTRKSERYLLSDEVKAILLKED